MGAAVDITPSELVSESSAPANDVERQRGLAEFFKETWSQALVAVSATEEEAQRVLSKVTNWVEVGPEEARRLRVELAEKLRRERDELEESIDTAVRRALTPFRLPNRDDIGALHARLTALEARVERLVALRVAPGERSSHSIIAQ